MSLSWEEYNFNGEYVEGFFVMEMMKRSWAAQLEVFDTIRDICKRHNITFYADWGTLLGAVRHKGFVPWDDDMDICMKRKDIKKFLEIAPKELPDEYIVLSPYYVQEYDTFFTRVVNGRGIDYSESHLEKYHNCPYVIGIDIFPIDIVPRDQAKWEQQKELLLLARQVMGYIKEKVISESDLSDINDMLGTTIGVSLNKNYTTRQQFYILYDQVCAMYSEADGDEYASIFDLARGWANNVPKEAYGIPIESKFMNTTVPLPPGYDRLLTIKYKKYMDRIIGGGSHSYPHFRYQELLFKKYVSENEISINSELRRLLNEIKYEGDFSWPINVNDFIKMCNNKFFYIDKTDIIGEIISCKDKVRMFIQPTKAGKSLASNTISAYLNEYHIMGEPHPFGKEEFKEKKFTINDSFEHYNTKFVLEIGFNGLDIYDYESLIRGFKGRIWETLCNLKNYIGEEILFSEDNSCISSQERDLIKKFYKIEGIASNDTWLCVFEIIIRLLNSYTKKEIYFIIDDYDKILKQAKNVSDTAYAEIINLLGKFSRIIVNTKLIKKIIIFSSEAIETEKLFGINVACEQIATDRKWFFFNESEIRELFSMCEMKAPIDMIRDVLKQELPGDEGYSYHPWNIIHAAMSLSRGASEIYKLI